MALHHRMSRLGTLLLILLLLYPTTEMQGQRGPGMRGGPAGRWGVAFGPRVGGDWDEEVWAFGGQLRISQPYLPGLQISPSADVFLLDGENEWQVNLDVHVRLLPIIYGGAGIAVAKDSLPTSAGPTTETGFNLFLGLALPTLRFPVRPFVELRLTEINRLVRPRRIAIGFDVWVKG